jgi:hypothetical protein
MRPTPSRTRDGATRRSSRAGLTAGIVAALAVAGAAPAWAFWSLSAGTTATATATSLQPPAAVTASATSLTSVTVTVTAPPAGGPVPASYRVVRGTTTVCAAVPAGTGCADENLTPGTTYDYAVTSRLESWNSATATTASAATGDVPAPSTPALTAASDSGTLGDGLTNVTAPSFTGTTTPGSTVTLTVDGVEAGPAVTADGSGLWTITPATPPSPDAAHTIRARTTVNGATSTDSAAFTLLIDTVRPLTGSATTSCSTAVTNGYCRGITTVTVTGLTDAAPGSGLAGLDHAVAGGASGTATVTGGTASFAVTGPDGSPAVTFTARDAAGNSATAGSVTPAAAIDRTAPGVTSLTLVNGGTQGRADKGDGVVVGFADAASAINPQSFCSAWGTAATTASVTANNAVTVTIADDGTNDTLTVAAGGACGTFNLGPVALGGDYVATGSVTFAGNGGNASALTWAGTGANAAGTLTVTLGGITGTSRTSVAAGTPVLTPSPLITDRAGNPAAGTFTGATSRF